MNPSALLSGLPAALGVVALSIVAGTVLIYYALRRKGDVRAEFSHGSTMFKLEAKEPGKKS
jgi:hypothetical protein